MRRARVLCFALGAALALAIATGCGSPEGGAAAAGGPQRYVVSTLLLAQASVLQDNLEAFKAELLAQGLDAEFRDSNAQGQISNVATIVNQMSTDPPDLVYVVGTPLVIATAQRLPDLPLVFGLMNDPVAAKVAASLDAPGGQATGTSGAVPASITLDLIAETVPGVKRIGMIGNPSEPNTKLEFDNYQAEATARGYELVIRPVINTGDVASAVRSLGDVDALVVPADNTVSSAINTVAQTAQELRVPTFDPAGSGYAQEGLTYAYGPNYDDLGKEAARQAATILRDKKSPGTIPVAGLRSGSPLELKINAKVAAAIGRPVPEAVRARATQVFD